MIITLSPQRSDVPIVLTRSGDVISVNGLALDLSGVAEGTILERSAAGFPWLASDVTRQSGILRFALLLPHGPVAPQETLFPDLLVVTDDGVIDLPPYTAEE